MNGRKSRKIGEIPELVKSSLMQSDPALLPAGPE